ncbi:MAG: hypothetical protein WD607_03270 [Candidatus Paceibacterota bacterium]
MNNDLPYVVDIFLNSKVLPELMQGTGIAILTFLISFAIGIFIHHLNQADEKGNYLDLHVALDHVWNLKFSIGLVLLVTTLPFLMTVDDKLSVFSLWVISLILLIWILIRLYKWVKGNKNDYRLEYLSNYQKSSQDKIVSWESFWRTDIVDAKNLNEVDFVKIFINEIDQLIKSNKSKNWKTASNLIDGFYANIEKRNKIYLIISEKFFPKILEWHFLVWKINLMNTQDLNNEYSLIKYEHIFHIKSLLNEIIRYVTKETLTGNGGHAFSYFNHLKNHVDKYKKEHFKINNNKNFYVNHVPIYQDCLEFMPESSESYDIWSTYFPSSWKINKRNLESNKIPWIWYDRFIYWAIPRIQRNNLNSSEDEWDEKLDDISKGLFDSVDPITWAKIITFILKPSEPRIKKFIEDTKVFGLIGRSYSSWNDKEFENQHKRYIDETIDLAVYLFGNKVFTEENIKKWIEDLNNLEYSKDSIEFVKKESWKNILTSILEKKSNEEIK